MHFDALVVRAIAHEWRETLIGGRVDRIFQPDRWSLALIVWNQHANQHVYISFNPTHAAVFLAREHKLRSGFEEPTAFVMLLRKYLESGRIVGIEQPALERRIELVCTQRTGETTTLVVELIGRQSNVILVAEDGTVLGVARPVTREMSRTRVILPGRPYIAPTGVLVSGERLDPRLVTEEELATALGDKEGGLDSDARARRLATILAMSPTAAAEAIARAGHGEKESHFLRNLAKAIRDLFAPLVQDSPELWQPTVARHEKEVIAFAPYRLTQHEASAVVEHCATMNEAVERFFVPRSQRQRIQVRQAELRARIQPLYERLQRRMTAIEHEITDAQYALQTRKLGELLLTYQPKIDQDTVMVDDCETGEPVTIAVDRRLTAVQNGQRYFARYARAKRAMSILEPQREALSIEAAFLSQLLFDIAAAETAEEVERVQREIAVSGVLKDELHKRQSRRPINVRQQKERSVQPVASLPEECIVGGFHVSWGKTSRANDTLTFTIAAKRDIWLHAKGVPGAHVVIHSRGQPVPEDVLVQSAQLAAYYSGCRGEGQALVDYTEVGKVRRQASGKPGLVWYTGERTLAVVPQLPCTREQT